MQSLLMLCCIRIIMPPSKMPRCLGRRCWQQVLPRQKMPTASFMTYFIASLYLTMFVLSCNLLNAWCCAPSGETEAGGGNEAKIHHMSRNHALSLFPKWQMELQVFFSFSVEKGHILLNKQLHGTFGKKIVCKCCVINVQYVSQSLKQQRLEPVPNCDIVYPFLCFKIQTILLLKIL